MTKLLLLTQVVLKKNSVITSAYNKLAAFYPEGKPP